MAKTFEVWTMNGSDVMAKTAGIESTAKSRSVVSTSRRTRRRGVTMRRPSRTTVKRPPCCTSAMGRKRRASRMVGLFSGCRES
jgi:hypothetical protein